MDVVGKAVKVAPDVVNTVGQIVKIVNQFSAQSTAGSQSISSQGWMDWGLSRHIACIRAPCGVVSWPLFGPKEAAAGF